MTALEKAARALLDRAGYTEYGPVVPEGLAIELARAVLMAVREPTDAMRKAIAHADWLGQTDLDWSDGWRIQLDAILNEGQP